MMATIEGLTFYGVLEIPNDAGIEVINCLILPNGHSIKISFPDMNYAKQIKESQND